MPETPEAVAFVLLEKIWKEENWDRQGPDGTRNPIHRRTILDTMRNAWLWCAEQQTRKEFNAEGADIYPVSS